MTRHFCDMCGKPADEDGMVIRIEKPLQAVNNGSKVQLKVIFSTACHPTGYSGAPDLCKDCKVSLAQEAIDNASA